MQIKQLTAEMLKFRLGEDPDIDPGWFVAHVDDIIRFNPDGCFALCDGEKVVGMITSTAYQTIGWLGWLFVLEEHRGQGLGEKLMQQGIDHLHSRGIKTVLLEADTKAMSLYHRLGFKEQFSTQHYVLTRGGLKAGHRALATIMPVGDDDLEHLARFDEEYFGQNRLDLFRLVVSNPNFRGFVARLKGDIAGYLFATEATENQQVSPLVADPSSDRSEEIAGALFREALKACPKPLHFRCPLVEDGYSEVLTNLGAGRVSYHTVRMYLGEDYRPERKGILSLGCPGKG